MAYLNKLTDYLRKSNEHIISLSFEEIEKILGTSLPEEARTKSKWWWNEKRNPQAHYWLDANYRTFDCKNIPSRGTVFFQKNEDESRTEHTELPSVKDKGWESKLDKSITYIGFFLGAIGFFTPNISAWGRVIIVILMLLIAGVQFFPNVKEKNRKIRATVIRICVLAILLLIGQSLYNDLAREKDIENSVSVSILPPEYKSLPIKVDATGSTVDFYCSDIAPILEFVLFNKLDTVATLTSFEIYIKDYKEFSENDILEHSWVYSNPSDTLLKRDEGLKDSNDTGYINDYKLDFITIGGEVFHDISNQEIYVIDGDGKIVEDSRISVEHNTYLRLQPEVNGSGHYTIQLVINYINLNGQYICKSKDIDFYYIDKSLKEILQENVNENDQLIDLGNAFYTAGYFNKAIEYYNLALEHHDKEDKETKLSKASLYNNIAIARAELGEIENAIELYKMALDIEEQIIGKDDLNTAKVYNNIAVLYGEKGDFDKSTDYLNKALSIIDKNQDTNSLFTAAVYCNFASVYCDLSDYGKAIDSYQNALAIQETFLGTEDYSIAITYNNIGVVYAELMKFDLALDNYNDALSLIIKNLGKNHPFTAITYGNMANVYKTLSKYAIAMDYYKKALAIQEDVLGIGNPATAITYNNIGVTYDALGDVDSADDYYRKALPIIEKIYGTMHPSTALLYNNIGHVFDERGQDNQALEWYKKALNIQKEVLGERHADTAKTYNNMGGAYSDIEGENEEALSCYNNALEIYKDIFGTEHSSTATVYHNIGVLYYKMDQREQAINNLTKALDIFSKIYGDDNEYVKDTKELIDIVNSEM